MSVLLLNVAQNLAENTENDFGETPLAYSPRVSVVSGACAVPQQYLSVERTLANLERVLAEIRVPPGFQLFAGQEGDILFLEVGIIGEENYPLHADFSTQPKIVYGRRWLIEATTPTSEVVQTALLAVKKAREHELREKFKLSSEQAGWATPFNCHQDLPLMAAQQRAFETPHSSFLNEEQLSHLLAHVTVGQFGFRIDRCTPLAGGFIFELAPYLISTKLQGTASSANDFPELLSGKLIVTCEQKTEAQFLHQLFSACLARSDRYVDEHFSFSGFHRFSHSISPVVIAQFSRMTRKLKPDDDRFNKVFEDMSYRVDSAKAPTLNAGVLGEQQRAFIKRQPTLTGYLPKAAK